MRGGRSAGPAEGRCLSWVVDCGGVGPCSIWFSIACEGADGAEPEPSPHPPRPGSSGPWPRRRRIAATRSDRRVHPQTASGKRSHSPGAAALERYTPVAPARCCTAARRRQTERSSLEVWSRSDGSGQITFSHEVAWFMNDTLRSTGTRRSFPYAACTDASNEPSAMACSNQRRTVPWCRTNASALSCTTVAKQITRSYDRPRCSSNTSARRSPVAIHRQICSVAWAGGGRSIASWAN